MGWDFEYYLTYWFAGFGGLEFSTFIHWLTLMSTALGMLAYFIIDRRITRKKSQQ